MNQRFSTGLFLLAFFPLSILAQSIDVSLESVLDVRAMDPKDSKLYLLFDVGAVSRDTSASVKFVDGYAIDDLGNRLLSDAPTSFVWNKVLSTQFESPPRAASRLQRVVLHLKILYPSVDNGAIVRVPAFYEKQGVNLLENKLDGRLIFKVLGSRDFDADPTELIKAVPAATPSDTDSPPEKACFIYDDPDQLISKINILDAEGEKVAFVSSIKQTFGDTVYRQVIYFNTPLQKDWQLEIILDTDAAMQEHILEFFDVELH